MAGFANGLLRGCSLAAGAVARFGMAAVCGTGACVRSVAVGGPLDVYKRQGLLGAAITLHAVYNLLIAYGGAAQYLSLIHI